MPAGLQIEKFRTHQDVVIVCFEVLPDILQEASLGFLLHGVIEVQLLRSEFQFLDLEGLGWQRDDGLPIDLVCFQPPHCNALHQAAHVLLS